MVTNNDTEVTGKPVATGKYSDYKFKVGDEVNVKYRGQLYPAIITKLLGFVNCVYKYNITGF